MLEVDTGVDDLFGFASVDPNVIFSEMFGQISDSKKSKNLTSEFDDILKYKKRQEILNPTVFSHTENAKMLGEEDDIFQRKRNRGILGAISRSKQQKKKEKAKQFSLREKERQAERRGPKQQEELSFGFMEFKSKMNSVKKPHPNKLRRQEAAEVKRNKREQVSQISQNKKDRKERKDLRRAARNGVSAEGEDYLSLDFIRNVYRNSCDGRLMDFTSLVVWVYQLSRSTTYVDFAAASFQFYKANFAASEVTLLELSQKFAKDTYEFFLSLKPLIKAEGMVADSIHLSISMFSTVLSSRVFTAFRDLVVTLVSLKWFNKDCALRLTSLFGKGKSVTLLEFFEQALNFVSLSISVVEDYFAGVPISEILLAHDPIKELSDKMSNLLVYSDHLYTGLPVEGQMCIKEYISEMTSCNSLAKALLARSNPLRSNTTALRALYVKGVTSVVNAQSRVLGRRRMTPIGVVLHGDPQVGKGHVLPLFGKWFSEVKGRAFEDTHIYNRATSSDYWEGYNPYSQPFIHYSEVGNDSRDVVMRQGDKTLTEVNRLVDSLPFNCDMASVELKGKVYAIPEMVLIDTNNKDMHISRLTSNPAAVRRRFLFIHQKVKPEFSKGGGLAGIDYQKSIQSDNDFYDKWLFTVTIEKPKSATASETEILCEEIDIFELKTFFKEYVTKHIAEYVSVEEEIASSELYQEAVCESLEEVDVPSPYFDFFKMASRASLQILESFAWVVLLWLFVFSLTSSPYLFSSRKRPTHLLIGIAAFFLFSSLFLWNWAILAILVLLIGSTMCSNTVANYFVKKQLKSMIATRWAIMRREVDLLSHLFLGSALPIRKRIPFALQRWHVLCGALLSIIGLLVYSTRKETYKGEAEVSPRLIELERTFHCGNSYKRVANKLEHNIWNSVVYHGSPVHTGSGYELMTSISTNIRRVLVVDKDGRSTRVHVFGVCEDIALINAHAIKSLPANIQVSVTGSFGDGNAVKITKITSQNVVQLGNDMCLVKLNAVRFKDHRKHLIPVFPGNTTRDGMIRNESLRLHFTEDTLNMDCGKVVNFISYQWVNHGDGQCGLPVLTQSGNGWQIAGIHCAGGNGNSYAFATVALRPTIEAGIEQLHARNPFMNIHSESEVYMSEASCELADKSSFRYVRQGNLEIFGKVSGPVLANLKSRLIRTTYSLPIIAKLASFGIRKTVQFLPPVMKPRVHNGEYQSPYNLALLKIGKQKGTLDMEILSRVKSKLLSRITLMLSDRGVATLSPLTIETAINGAPDDAFLRRINASTAGGFGFRGKKDTYIPLVDELKRMPVPVLEQRLIDRMEEYLSGESSGTIYSAKLKDEPRPAAKVKAGKTRVFYVQSIDSLILQRMFLAPFYTLMTQFGDIFCTAVGINMHSDAGGLVTRLNEFSPLIGEGDFGAYDQTSPYEVGLCANSLILDILEHLGYNSEALKVSKGILSDSLFPTIEMLGELFEASGLQVSGKYATAEDNSLKLLIKLMYAWEISGLQGDFFDNVLPYTYGDDVLFSIKERVSPYFNACFFKEVCNNIFKMEFTSATKDSILLPYLTTKEMSFLKRKFIFDERYQKWKAPLDPNSIIKSLEWSIPSSFITPFEQAVSTTCSALREIFFHVAEEQYLEILSVARASLVENFSTTEEYVNGILPTWEDIIATLQW